LERIDVGRFSGSGVRGGLNAPRVDPLSTRPYMAVLSGVLGEKTGGGRGRRRRRRRRRGRLVLVGGGGERGCMMAGTLGLFQCP